MMKGLVIGYGSAGSRHARILANLGCDTAVVSQRHIDFEKNFKTIDEAVQSHNPDMIIIANETSKHYPTLLELLRLNYSGIVLVEKPLFSDVKPLPELPFKKLLVAYNLRFHPIIQRLYSILKEEDIVSVTVHVGQYLPSWRPNRDYRFIYSANKSLGGGVLRDLSHELDYINWLLNGWTSMVAHGGKYSSLEIDTDDIYNIIMTTKRCPNVHLQLNYLDRIARREIVINTNSSTIKADLIKNILQINNQIEEFRVERDTTYYAQLKAILDGDFRYFCNEKDGLEIMKMIEAAEQSVQQKRWISR